MFCTSFLVNFPVVVMQFSFIVKHLALLLSALAQHRHLIRMRVLLWCTKMSCSFLCNRKIVAFVLKKYSTLKQSLKTLCSWYFLFLPNLKENFKTLFVLESYVSKIWLKKCLHLKFITGDLFSSISISIDQKGKKQLNYITQTYNSINVDLVSWRNENACKILLFNVCFNIRLQDKI